LRHRNFQLFFAGQLISLIGTWMQNVAQSWLVYRLTGSSVLLGMVALIQTMTPDHLRGRVMAVYSMMFMGMAPIGALLSGVLADRFGAPFTVAMGGVIAIGGSFAFGLRLPALRPKARRLIMAQHMVAGDPADEVTAHGGGDPD
jgi:MFS family permease